MDPEMAALEAEVVAVLASEMPAADKLGRLFGLRRAYRDCLRRYDDLLLVYARRARGRSPAEAATILPTILVEFGLSDFDGDCVAAVLAILFPGVIDGFSVPGFPLPPVRKPVVDHTLCGPRVRL